MAGSLFRRGRSRRFAAPWRIASRCCSYAWPACERLCRAAAGYRGAPATQRRGRGGRRLAQYQEAARLEPPPGNAKTLTPPP